LIYTTGLFGGNGFTVSCALTVWLVPLVFLQVNVYVKVLTVARLPVFKLPVPGLVPLQSPPAVQLEGLFVASQTIVELSPAYIIFGFAAILTAGTPRVAEELVPGRLLFGAETLTATVLKPVPVAVLQVRVNR